MNRYPASKSIGVVLVDNIPLQTTDSQLDRFFKELDDVSSIQFLTNEGEADQARSCWIHVANPAQTVKKINFSTIGGQNPRARLMGYLFAA